MSIQLRDGRAGYDGFTLQDISLDITAGSFTALIGPNGCGKSTFLHMLAGILPLRNGSLTIDELNIPRSKPKTIAKKLAMLPQSPMVPPSITVEQLVGYGRAPHQNLLGMRNAADLEATEAALAITNMRDLRNKPISALSGGQRQRGFIAMCLAQETPYILLDEPTSFLDIRYQFETLNLLKEQQKNGKTIIVVLHDIAQAARFADHVVVLRDGWLRYEGPPQAVITASMLREIYGVEAQIYPDPISGTPAISIA